MQYTDEQLLAYLDGSLVDQERRDIANWLESSTEATQRLEELRLVQDLMAASHPFEPSDELDWKFQSMLKLEMSTMPAKTSPWLQVAAGFALLLIGALLGRLFAPAVPMGEIAGLRQQVEALQLTVIDRTLTSASASERLQVLQTSSPRLHTSDQQLAQILLHTLNTDESPNVRYAALDALAKLSSSEEIRLALVKSLEYQKEPIIQIALINTLAMAGEKAAIGPLKAIIKDENTLAEVKKQATIAYNILL